MSLTVFPYRRRADGRVVRLDARPSPPRDDLAGTLASRQALWGAEVLRACGCTLLPRLAGGDLHVEGPALDHLESEANGLIREARRIAEATEHRPDWIVHRARNVLEAVRLCRAHGGDGVFLGEATDAVD
jgi:hypothetical protein